MGKAEPVLVYSCLHYGPLTRYERVWVAHAPGMPGAFSPPSWVSDTDMHHGTCVTHVPWCMRDRQLAVSSEVGSGENVPGIPGACVASNCTYLVRGPLRSYHIGQLEGKYDRCMDEVKSLESTWLYIHCWKSDGYFYRHMENVPAQCIIIYHNSVSGHNHQASFVHVRGKS